VNLLYEVEIVGGELAGEAAGSSDMAAWCALDDVPTLSRSEIMEVRLGWRSRRS
jgi:hypothetical protein